MITLDDARRRATLNVPEAGELLGISRNAAYRAAHAGEIPVVTLGRRLVVPTGRLLVILGRPIDPPGPHAPEAA